MRVTINLYTGKSYRLDEVSAQVSDKNPVVFIVTKETDDSVYSMVNISNSLRKYICIANSFDAPKVVAYLSSFEDSDRLKVLMMAPSDKRDRAIIFTKRVIGCVNRVVMARKIRVRR